MKSIATAVILFIVSQKRRYGRPRNRASFRYYIDDEDDDDEDFDDSLDSFVDDESIDSFLEEFEREDSLSSETCE